MMQSGCNEFHARAVNQTMTVNSSDKVEVWQTGPNIHDHALYMDTVFPLLYDERGGPPHSISKPPHSKFAKIATL